MLQPKDMLVIEELDPAAPPAFTEIQNYPQGTKKYEQLGTHCYTNIIGSILTKLELSAREGLVVHDLNPGVGHSLED